MSRISEILALDLEENTRISVFLAPMAGITDWAMRLISEKHGCSASTTEMISAQGFLSARKSRGTYQRLIARAPFEKPLSIQIFGHEPEYMAEAAHVLSHMQRYSSIDINMGCPAKKVTSGGSGSALMKDEKLAGKIISEVVKASLLPVSVKMRLGWDSEHINVQTIARIAENEGAAFITVHGRTTQQQYSGHADWDTIRTVKESVHIPVIANGDIADGASALQALNTTSADGLAIGRAALGNPWVFEEILAALENRPYDAPVASERIATAMLHASYLRAALPEKRALLEMRKFYSWYIKGMRGAAEVRTRINTAQAFDEVDEILKAMIDVN